MHRKVLSKRGLGKLIRILQARFSAVANVPINLNFISRDGQTLRRTQLTASKSSEIADFHLQNSSYCIRVAFESDERYNFQRQVRALLGLGIRKDQDGRDYNHHCAGDCRKAGNYRRPRSTRLVWSFVLFWLRSTLCCHAGLGLDPA
jgi:hypothetical protein